MSGQRTRYLIRAVINGYPCLGELEEYTRPEIEKEVEEARGGRFIAEEIMTGIKLLEANLKLMGVGREVFSAMGVKNGDRVEIDVYESQQDKAGNVYGLHDQLTGEVKKLTFDTVKQKDKPGVELGLTLNAYKLTEDSEIVFDINVDTQYIDLGQGDIMAEHRRNVNMA